MNAIEKSLIRGSSSAKLELYESLVKIGCETKHFINYREHITTISLYLNKIHIDSIYLYHDNRIAWRWER